MKKNSLAAFAFAAALCAGGASHAAVLNFDNPGQIVFDSNGMQTYTESGFTLSGPPVSFLPLDSALVGDTDGTNSAISLMAVGGAAFSLMSIDYAFYDLSFGSNAVPPGMLSVIGFVNGAQVASQSLTLGGLQTFSFGAGFGNLTEVNFIGSTAFALDNLTVGPAVAAVPEPATAVLMATGLLGVMLGANRRRKRA